MITVARLMKAHTNGSRKQHKMRQGDGDGGERVTQTLMGRVWISGCVCLLKFSMSGIE